MEIKFIRYIRHKNEYDIYPAADPNTFNLIWCVNTGREIVFRDLKAKRPLYLIPFGRLTYQEQKDFNSTNSSVVTKSEWVQRNNFVSNAQLDKVVSNVGVDL